MTDPKDVKKSTSSVVEYTALDNLYDEVFKLVSKELDLSCSLTDFNKIIDKKQFISEMAAVVKEHGSDSPDAHSKLLGFAAAGVGMYANRGTINPAAAATSMFNIARLLYPQTTFAFEQFAAKYDIDLGASIAGLADAIGSGMKGGNMPFGANIFNRGGRGGKGGGPNDDGELRFVPDDYRDDYYHHEPVKNELVWNLGLENTMQGTEPFWDSNAIRSCFVGKFNMMQFPNDDVDLKYYYETVLIPVLRNAVQANKRYNADLSSFFTYDMFKTYINEVIQSVAIYYFFANGFAYCNQPGLVNNNEALRYLRQELFSTAQLQRFQQLGQLIDSLPIPQTLINAIAQYHGWYSNSPEACTTLYCNIPHGIFVDNTYQNSSVWGRAGCLDKLQTDVILGEINKLNSPFVSDSTPEENQRKSDKFLGLLLNTIPGWRNSSVGGSAFSTDLYDEAHWNEFMNSPVINTVTLYKGASQQRTSRYLYPQYDISGLSYNYRYHSVGSDTPGYLQAYFTPLEYSDPPTYSKIAPHGIIKPQARSIQWSMPIGSNFIVCETSSNIMVWANGALFDNNGSPKTRGFTLFPTDLTQYMGSNIASPYLWHIDNGDRGEYQAGVFGYASVRNNQPPCTYNTTNMSLNQCMPNRLLAVQKLLDIQEFFDLTSGAAVREKPRSGGRRGRRGNSKKSGGSEVSSEDFKES